MSLPVTQRNVFLRAAALEEAQERAHGRLRAARVAYTSARKRRAPLAEIEPLAAELEAAGDAYVIALEKWRRAQAAAQAVLSAVLSDAPAGGAAAGYFELPGMDGVCDL